MKNKILYLTILVYLSLLVLEIINIKDYTIHKESINKIVDKVFIKKETNIKTEKYDGYLEYKSIKRLIVGGTNQKVLDKNLVWIYKADEFQNLTGNIVLAGHNNKYVFNFITKILVDDTITIYTKNIQKEYVVYDKKIIDENANIISYLDDNNKLLLITCVNNNTKRLIIFAKEL